MSNLITTTTRTFFEIILLSTRLFQININIKLDICFCIRNLNKTKKLWIHSLRSSIQHLDGISILSKTSIRFLPAFRITSNRFLLFLLLFKFQLSAIQFSEFVGFLDSSYMYHFLFRTRVKFMTGTILS